MASTMIQSSGNSTSENFVRGRTLYTETTESTVTTTTRQTKINETPSNYRSNVLNRQNSSLYTGSIFAAFNSDIEVQMIYTKRTMYSFNFVP